MKSTVVRQYDCDGCGTREHVANSIIHGPQDWREVLGYTLCGICVTAVANFIEERITARG